MENALEKVGSVIIKLDNSEVPYHDYSFNPFPMWPENLEFMETEFKIIAGNADKLTLIIPFCFKTEEHDAAKQVDDMFHKYYGDNEPLAYPHISLPYYRDKESGRRIKNNLIKLDRYDTPYIMIDGNVSYSVTEHTEDHDYHGHIDKNIYNLLAEVLLKNNITLAKFVDDGHYIMIIDKVGMPTWTAIWNSPIGNHKCERYYLINGKLEVHDGNEI